jgi:hypothetical protein
MKIAFTLCSLNYLAQAKVLGDSLLAQNPDYVFYIGLVDRLSVDAQEKVSFVPYPLVPIEDLAIDGFAAMCQYYNLVELNTAVKAHYFQYFFLKQAPGEFVVYLDPDTYLFNPLRDLETMMEEYSLALTPHFLSPMAHFTKIDEFKRFSFDNNFHYFEERFALYSGIYNLGFVAIKNDPTGQACVKWWGDRLQHQAYISDIRGYHGLFCDQSWMNLAPIFYDKTFTIRHKGYNVAPWNLHEREPILTGTSAKLSTGEPLVFYHFSGLIYQGPRFSKWLNRTFVDYPHLQPFYEMYREKLAESHHEELRSVPCYFMVRQKQLANQTEQLRLAQLPRYRRVGGRLLKALWSLLPGFTQRLSKSLLQFLLAKVNEFEAAAKVASK